MFYKEFKDKTYIYYQNDLTYYIPGVNTWKKVSKGLTYEDYDTTLFSTVNLYNVLKENTEITSVTDTDSIKKSLVKVDLNKLIKIYNSTKEDDEAIALLEDGTTFLNFYIYNTDEDHLVLTVDLKDYYKQVYNKEYDYIIYGFDFSKVGEISLDTVESMEFTQ
ncbi:hypothetical protein EOM09_05275 [bacterium]|nr:hypothetical protein [bacterium]